MASIQYNYQGESIKRGPEVAAPYCLICGQRLGRSTGYGERRREENGVETRIALTIDTPPYLET